jgi:probable phosphoglycerate mutase
MVSIPENLRIFILRHGESEANVDGKIRSDPNDCVNGYGLTDKGKEMANKSAVSFFENYISKFNSEKQSFKFEIYSSDFKRARETAECFKKALMVFCEKVSETPIIFDIRLRERNFGEWNGKSNIHYNDCWEIDEKDSSLNINNVESCIEVLERVKKFLKYIIEPSLNTSELRVYGFFHIYIYIIEWWLFHMVMCFR